MVYENPSLARFSERMSLWLPGAFSFALILLSLAWNPRLTGGSQVAMPWHIACLMMGILGGTVHAVLLRYNRRIQALEEALERTTTARSK
jgi:hypothetical protein